MHVESPSLMIHIQTLGKLRNGANVILAREVNNEQRYLQ
jgi:hypothetical protein